ncbi:MAG: hypothetical protein HY926_09540 [Elusimicrobia bacterium]|nr:hypothetical protein [Elusimicrobiota bacterium]
MARLLGLAQRRGWALEGLCREGRRGVRLCLRGGTHSLVFRLGPGLSLAAEGAAGPSVERLSRALSRRLRGRRLEDVLRLIEADPLSFAQTATPGAPQDRVRVPCVGQPIGILDAGWRNFFADQDFEVLLGVPECSPKGTVTIQYADGECYYARPQRSFNKWNFLDWPDVALDETPGRDVEGDSLITTELTERDMILGTGARADAVVAEARRLAKTGKTLVFTHLCTPIIMGEDFQGLARRCLKEVGGATVNWSQKDRDENNNFGDYFRGVLERPGFFKGRGDPRSVNLFHFPARCREEELRPFLEKVGVRVNICVFPEVTFPSIPDLPKARWQVFCERSSYPTKVRELLAASPRRVLDVRAPYGVEGTRECLAAIAAAAGQGKAFAQAWKERLKTFRPAWEELRRQAQGHRLAFVVSEATLPRLLMLRYGYGAPLAPMVREMGFGIDLLYYDLHGRAPELPQELAGAGVTTFRSPWELERALREGSFSAAFSDICFDWRLTRAGKARFSSRDFEMGLEGARRTFARLLDVCRLPFYRRYAAELSSSRRPFHA